MMKSVFTCVVKQEIRCMRFIWYCMYKANGLTLTRQMTYQPIVSSMHAGYSSTVYRLTDESFAAQTRLMAV